MAKLRFDLRDYQYCDGEKVYSFPVPFYAMVDVTASSSSEMYLVAVGQTDERLYLAYGRSVHFLGKVAGAVAIEVYAVSGKVFDVAVRAAFSEITHGDQTDWTPVAVRGSERKFDPLREAVRKALEERLGRMGLGAEDINLILDEDENELDFDDPDLEVGAGHMEPEEGDDDEAGDGAGSISDGSAENSGAGADGEGQPGGGGTGGGDEEPSDGGAG